MAESYLNQKVKDHLLGGLLSSQKLMRALSLYLSSLQGINKSVIIHRIFFSIYHHHIKAQVILGLGVVLPTSHLIEEAPKIIQIRYVHRATKIML